MQKYLLTSLKKLISCALIAALLVTSHAPVFAQALLPDVTGQTPAIPQAFRDDMTTWETSIHAALERRANGQRALQDICKRIPFCAPVQDLRGDALVYLVPGAEYKTALEARYDSNPDFFATAITQKEQGAKELGAILAQIRPAFNNAATGSKERGIIIEQLLPALLAYNDDAIKAFALEAASKEIASYNSRYDSGKAIGGADIAHLPGAIILYGMAAPQGREHKTLTELLGKGVLSVHAPALVFAYASAMIAMGEYRQLGDFIKNVGAYELGGGKTQAGAVLQGLGEMLSITYMVEQNRFLRDKYAGGHASPWGFYALQEAANAEDAVYYNVWEDLPYLLVEAGDQEGAQLVREIFNHGLTLLPDRQAFSVPRAVWERGALIPFIVGAIGSGAVSGGAVPANMTSIARYYGANKTGLVELSLLGYAMSDLNNGTYKRVREALRGPYMAQINDILNNREAQPGRANFNVTKSLDSASAFFASDPVFNGTIYNRNAQENGVQKPSGIILNHSDASRLAAKASWAQITKATTIVDLGISVYFMANLGRTLVTAGASLARFARQQAVMVRLIRTTGMPAGNWAVEVANLHARGMRQTTIVNRLSSAATRAQRTATRTGTPHAGARADLAQSKVELAQSTFRLQEAAAARGGTAAGYAQKVADYNRAETAMSNLRTRVSDTKPDPLETFSRALRGLDADDGFRPAMGDLGHILPRGPRGPSFGARYVGYITDHFGPLAGRLAQGFRYATHQTTIGAATLMFNYSVATTPVAASAALRLPVQTELVASAARTFSAGTTLPQPVFTVAPSAPAQLAALRASAPARPVTTVRAPPLRATDLVDPKLLQMKALVTGGLSLRPLLTVGAQSLAVLANLGLRALTKPAPVAPTAQASAARASANAQPADMPGVEVGIERFLKENSNSSLVWDIMQKYLETAHADYARYAEGVDIAAAPHEADANFLAAFERQLPAMMQELAPHLKGPAEAEELQRLFTIAVGARQTGEFGDLSLFNVQAAKEATFPLGIMDARGEIVDSGSSWLTEFLGVRYLITNEHVVAGEEDVRVYDGKQWHYADVLFTAQGIDIAVMRVKDPSFAAGVEPIQISLAAPNAQEPLLSVSYPTALDIGNLRRFTTQRVAALKLLGTNPLTGFYHGEPVITAGSSGSPLLRADGRAVGMAALAYRAIYDNERFSEPKLASILQTGSGFVTMKTLRDAMKRGLADLHSKSFATTYSLMGQNPRFAQIDRALQNIQRAAESPAPGADLAAVRASAQDGERNFPGIDKASYVMDPALTQFMRRAYTAPNMQWVYPSGFDMFSEIQLRTNLLDAYRHSKDYNINPYILALSGLSPAKKVNLISFFERNPQAKTAIVDMANDWRGDMPNASTGAPFPEVFYTKRMLDVQALPPSYFREEMGRLFTRMSQLADKKGSYAENYVEIYNVFNALKDYRFEFGYNYRLGADFLKVLQDRYDKVNSIITADGQNADVNTLNELWQTKHQGVDIDGNAISLSLEDFFEQLTNTKFSENNTPNFAGKSELWKSLETAAFAAMPKSIPAAGQNLRWLQNPVQKFKLNAKLGFEPGLYMSLEDYVKFSLTGGAEGGFGGVTAMDDISVIQEMINRQCTTGIKFCSMERKEGIYGTGEWSNYANTVRYTPAYTFQNVYMPIFHDGAAYMAEGSKSLRYTHDHLATTASQQRAQKFYLDLPDEARGLISGRSESILLEKSMPSIIPTAKQMGGGMARWLAYSLYPSKFVNGNWYVDRRAVYLERAISPRARPNFSADDITNLGLKLYQPQQGPGFGFWGGAPRSGEVLNPEAPEAAAPVAPAALPEPVLPVARIPLTPAEVRELGELANEGADFSMADEIFRLRTGGGDADVVRQMRALAAQKNTIMASAQPAQILRPRRERILRAQLSDDDLRAALNGRGVFTIGDEPNFRLLEADARRYGARVSNYSSLGSLLTAIKTQNPADIKNSLVVTDYNMGGLRVSGDDVLAEVKKIDPDIYVTVASAMSDDGYVMALRARGYDNVLFPYEEVGDALVPSRLTARNIVPLQPASLAKLEEIAAANTQMPAIVARAAAPEVAKALEASLLPMPIRVKLRANTALGTRGQEVYLRPFTHPRRELAVDNKNPLSSAVYNSPAVMERLQQSLERGDYADEQKLLNLHFPQVKAYVLEEGKELSSFTPMVALDGVPQGHILHMSSALPYGFEENIAARYFGGKPITRAEWAAINSVLDKQNAAGISHSELMEDDSFSLFRGKDGKLNVVLVNLDEFSLLGGPGSHRTEMSMLEKELIEANALEAEQEYYEISSTIDGEFAPAQEVVPEAAARPIAMSVRAPQAVLRGPIIASSAAERLPHIVAPEQLGGAQFRLINGESDVGWITLKASSALGKEGTSIILKTELHPGDAMPREKRENAGYVADYFGVSKNIFFREAQVLAKMAEGDYSQESDLVDYIFPTALGRVERAALGLSGRPMLALSYVPAGEGLSMTDVIDNFEDIPGQTWLQHYFDGKPLTRGEWAAIKSILAKQYAMGIDHYDLIFGDNLTLRRLPDGRIRMAHIDVEFSSLDSKNGAITHQLATAEQKLQQLGLLEAEAAPAQEAAPSAQSGFDKFMEGFGGNGALNSFILPLPQIIRAVRSAAQGVRNLFTRNKAPATEDPATPAQAAQPERIMLRNNMRLSPTDENLVPIDILSRNGGRRRTIFVDSPVRLREGESFFINHEGELLYKKVNEGTTFTKTLVNTSVRLERAGQVSAEADLEGEILEGIGIAHNKMWSLYSLAIMAGFGGITTQIASFARMQMGMSMTEAILFQSLGFLPALVSIFLRPHTIKDLNRFVFAGIGTALAAMAIPMVFGMYGHMPDVLTPLQRTALWAAMPVMGVASTFLNVASSPRIQASSSVGRIISNNVSAGMWKQIGGVILGGAGFATLSSLLGVDFSALFPLYGTALALGGMAYLKFAPKTRTLSPRSYQRASMGDLITKDKLVRNSFLAFLAHMGVIATMGPNFNIVAGDVFGIGNSLLASALLFTMPMFMTRAFINSKFPLGSVSNKLFGGLRLSGKENSPAVVGNIVQKSAINAAVGLALVMSGVPALQTLGIALSGVGVGVVSPVLTAFVAKNREKDIGRVSALMNITTIGSILGPMGAAYVADLTGLYSTVFLLPVALLPFLYNFGRNLKNGNMDAAIAGPAGAATAAADGSPAQTSGEEPQAPIEIGPTMALEARMPAAVIRAPISAGNDLPLLERQQLQALGNEGESFLTDLRTNRANVAGPLAIDGVLQLRNLRSRIPLESLKLPSLLRPWETDEAFPMADAVFKRRQFAPLKAPPTRKGVFTETADINAWINANPLAADQEPTYWHTRTARWIQQVLEKVAALLKQGEISQSEADVYQDRLQTMLFAVAPVLKQAAEIVTLYKNTGEGATERSLRGELDLLKEEINLYTNYGEGGVYDAAKTERYLELLNEFEGKISLAQKRNDIDDDTHYLLWRDMNRYRDGLENTAKNAEMAIEAQQNPAARAVLEGKTFIIVQDDPDVANTMKTVLSAFGPVHTFESTHKATDFLEEMVETRREELEKFILISDLMFMTGGSGLGLSEEAKSIAPRMPVIISTGLGAGASRKIGDGVIRTSNSSGWFDFDDMLHILTEYYKNLPPLTDARAK